MPIVKPIKFVQIAINADHIIGLTPEGEVYFRDKPPFTYNTTGYSHVNGFQKKDDDAKVEKKCWKKLYMYELIELPKGGEVREAQSADEGEKQEPTIEVVVDEAPRKVYKDIETVKKVQTALKAKGFYIKTGPNDTYKIDGDMGHLTTTAIKDFQRSVNLKDTGEIDHALWKALGLLSNIDDNETVVPVNENDIVEDTDEVAYCS